MDLNESDDSEYNDLTSFEESSVEFITTVNELSNLIQWHEQSTQYFLKLKETYERKGCLEAYSYQQTNKLSKKPPNVTFTLKGKKQHKEAVMKVEEMKGAELLTALKPLLRSKSERKSGNVRQFDESVSDVDEITKAIFDGEMFISHKHVSILKDAVQLGLWLQRLHDIDINKYHETVEENCKFSLSWANKLRAFSCVFGKHRKLQYLDLSLTTAIKISRKVDQALSTYPDHATFWQ